MNNNGGEISNSRELEFVLFCIENISLRLNIDARRVYNALSKKSDILSGYIVLEYEILHTQSKDYIVEGILSVMREEGVWE